MCVVRQDIMRLQQQLMGLIAKSKLVLQHTRKAVVINSEGKDAVNTYSPDAHERALLAQAKGLAVLSERLAPMVFRLVCGFTSLARQMADGQAPFEPEVTALMNCMCQVLGTLLQCQQEDGEACNVKVAEHAKGAQENTRALAEQQSCLKQQEKAAMRAATSQSHNNAVSTTASLGATLVVAELAAGPIGWLALVAAGGAVTLANYIGGCEKVDAHVDKARQLAADGKAAREARLKAESALMALQPLQTQLNPKVDAGNGTVTGLLAMALLGIVASLKKLLDHLDELLRAPGGIADQALLRQVDTLHDAALNAEMQWDVEVRGGACGLLKASNVAMNSTLLGEWLESHRDRLAEDTGFTMEQATKVIKDINTLPSGAMAGEAILCYMTNNKALLLDHLRQVVPQLLANANGVRAAPASGPAAA